MPWLALFALALAFAFAFVFALAFLTIAVVPRPSLPLALCLRVGRRAVVLSLCLLIVALRVASLAPGPVPAAIVAPTVMSSVLPTAVAGLAPFPLVTSLRTVGARVA